MSGGVQISIEQLKAVQELFFSLQSVSESVSESDKECSALIDPGHPMPPSSLQKPRTTDTQKEGSIHTVTGDRKKSSYAIFAGLGAYDMSEMRWWLATNVPDLRVTRVRRINIGQGHEVFVLKFFDSQHATAFRDRFNGREVFDGKEAKIELCDHRELMKSPEKRIIDEWKTSTEDSSDLKPQFVTGSSRSKIRITVSKWTAGELELELDTGERGITRRDAGRQERKEDPERR